MKNIKEFQERYQRWKDGERYWDIRGIDLPKYDNANKQIQVPYNLDNQVYDAEQLPEVVISTPNKFGVTPTDLPDIYKTTNGDFVHVDKGSSKDALSFINPYNGKRVYTDAMLAENARANTRYENFLQDRAIAQSIGLDPILPFQNLANGQYKQAFNNAVNSLAWLGGPIGVAARTYAGARNLTSDDGLRKTYKLFDAGQYDKAALSAVGDIFNAAAVKYGVDTGMQKAYPYLQKFGNNLNKFAKQFNEDYISGAFRRKADVAKGYDPYNIYYGDQVGKQIYNTPQINPYFSKAQVDEVLKYTNSPAFKDKLAQLPQPQQKKLLEYINTWKNAVGPDGTINSHEIVNKLKQLKQKYPNIFDNFVKHPRKNNPIEEYQKTLRHMYNAAKTAQTMPVAKGSTKQEQVFAALTHDIGEFIDRGTHPQQSVKLLQELYPDVPQKVLHSIDRHMDKDVLAQTPLTRALHFADVASGNTYEKQLTLQPSLQYPQQDMPTNIGKIGDDRWEYVVDHYINPIFEKRGYPLLDKSQGYDAVRKQLIDTITQDKTFVRGVRLKSGDINISKSIQDLESRLTKQLGRKPTYEELRKQMAIEIPPYTGSGRRGLPEMKNSTDKDHSYNGLYYSNSNETGSGYGAADQDGALYKATLPVVNDPNYSLMDLWVANNFPLYDVYKHPGLYGSAGLSSEYMHGDLHTKYEGQALYEDPEFLNFEKYIDSGGIYNKYKFLDDKPIRKRYVDLLMKINSKLQQDPDFLSAYKTSDIFSTLLPKIESKIKYNPAFSNDALMGLRQQYEQFFGKQFDSLEDFNYKSIDPKTFIKHFPVELDPLLSHRNDTGIYKYVYKNIPELKFMDSLSSFIKRRVKKYENFKNSIKTEQDFQDLMPVLDDEEKFYDPDLVMGTYHADKNLIDVAGYLNNKRVSKQNKKILCDILGIDPEKKLDENFSQIPRDKLNALSQDYISKKIIDFVKTEQFREEFDKQLLRDFYKLYNRNQRAFYMSMRGEVLNDLLGKYFKSKRTEKTASMEANKDGLISPIFTKEFLKQPKVFTTEGHTINYKDRNAAQHYIIFDKSGRQVFRPEDVQKVGKGGKRISNDRGDMDSSLSHKTYNKGKN